MKKAFLIVMVMFVIGKTNSNAQIMDEIKKIDFSKINISSLLNKTLNVKQGWAPKFSFGNLGLANVEKVSKIINLKNINTAKKLFSTFKTGRTIYKAGAYVGLAASTYSSIKNIVETNKEALTAEAKQLKSDAIAKSQKFLVAGGATILTGVVIKFLTKKAASKAADAFNGAVRKKITDILSFDAPTPSMYATNGIALKIRL